MNRKTFALSLVLFPALLIVQPSWAAKQRSVVASAEQAPAQRPQREMSARPSLPFNDTRLAVFEFDPNLTYEIKTLDSLYTHIEIAPGDKIRGFYPSDTTRWKYHIAGNKERLFIKPTAPGLFNSVTMVTERRVYELTFVSGKEGDSWYKRVNWHYPGERAQGDQDTGFGGAAGMEGVYEDLPMPQMAAAPAGRNFIPQAGADMDDGESSKIDPSTLRFSYTIEGSAVFRPVTVFDNGKFTWVRFKDGLQDMPGVFSLDAAGKAEVIDYVPSRDNREIVITKVMPGVLLKLKDEEVRITNTDAGKGDKKFCLLGCRP